ncbi:pheromone processing endoprotease [Blyttiomyces sp. JEL0837]|nr:pheromone processing endoprotease [Blyttiomyces sp. JEL0837]
MRVQLVLSTWTALVTTGLLTVSCLHASTIPGVAAAGNSSPPASQQQQQAQYNQVNSNINNMINTDAQFRPPPNDHQNYHYFAIQLESPFTPKGSDMYTSTDHEAITLKYSTIARRAFHTRAEDIADELNVHFVGRVGELPDFFQYAIPKRDVNLWVRDRMIGLGRRESTLNSDQLAGLDESEHARTVSELIKDHPDIVWVEAQVPKLRLFKREPSSNDEMVWDLNQANSGPVSVSGALFARQSVPEYLIAEKELNISDPEFRNQWHLINPAPDQRGNDLNVTGVWSQGILGEGVNVCFVDDGLDYESNDLKDNFFAAGSYDYNDHVALPKPRTQEDRHGTRCAGEVAAVRNSVCGVGVAYKSKVSGVRILSGALTEADEAAAINYNYEENHIYSCSWGPSDNGMSMEAPPTIVKNAVKNGIVNGRRGLGSVFVFAAGNGGTFSDNCNFDGYTNSIYTITVAAIDRKNQHPAYSELCSANLIAMYASPSAGSREAIVTTDWALGHKGDLCTTAHGGTSAAAPLASGVYALVLSIRNDLTWRDIQHLTVRTAVQVNPSDPSWTTAPSTRPYSHKFGYGRLDAYAIVEAAKTWKLVNPQVKIEMPVVEIHQPIPEEAGKDVRAIIKVTKEMVDSVQMSRIEHITVTMSATHDKRGDVNVDLISPNGFVSNLAVARFRDNDSGGFKNWTFMTVKHWDENPTGDWQVVVFDHDNIGKKGVLDTVAVTFWGEGPPTNPKKKPVETPPQETDNKVSVTDPIAVSTTSTTSVSTTEIVQSTTTASTVAPSPTTSQVVGQNDTQPVPGLSNSPSSKTTTASIMAILFVCFFGVVGVGYASYFYYDKIWQFLRPYIPGNIRRQNSYEFTGLNKAGDTDEESLDEFDFDPEEIIQMEKGGYVDEEIDDLISQGRDMPQR